MTEKFNGSANWETWNTSLWLNNERWIYSLCMHKAHRASDVNDLTNDLKKLFDQGLAPHGLYADLKGEDSSLIDWEEIAQEFMEDVQ